MKILFMGRKKYAAQMLRWTVEQGNNVVGVVTDSQFPNSPTMLEAQRLGIPVMLLEQAQNAFEKDNDFADLVVSYLFWELIKEPLISSPLFGCINFHPAILPDWKGCAGYNIAILNKLEQWGASAHYVDKTIDTGPIIRVYRFDFDYRFETAQSLENKTQKIQCDLYKSVLLDLMQENNLRESTIPNTGGTYISKKQMLQMMEVDPENDDVKTKCRAFWFPPYSGATIEIKGEKYTLVDEFILYGPKADDQTVPPPRADLVIVGAGGFGREIAWQMNESWYCKSYFNVIGFVDNNPALHGTCINGFPVLGDDKWLLSYQSSICVALCIAKPNIRKSVYDKLIQNANITFPTIITNGTHISSTAKIGQGSIICLNTIITTNTTIGDFVIINPNCAIAHDSAIDNFATLCYNVNIAGNVKIGAGTELGTGSTVIQNLAVGENTTLGAGAVVVSNIPPDCTALGIPARVINNGGS